MEPASFDDKTLEPCPMFVDTQPRRRSVSISSVDSEPIMKYHRVEDDHASSDGGLSVAGNKGLGDTELDLSDDNMYEEVVTCIPLERVSAAHAATVVSIFPSSNKFVAENQDDAVVMNVGTHIFSAEGSFIGCITNLIGPVSSSLYVVVSKRDDFQELVASGVIAEGTRLYTDVSQQKVIHNLPMQCDIAIGTDASYVNDEELPDNVKPDFSDDEKEVQWKRTRKARKLSEGSVSSEEARVDVDWSTLHLDDEAKEPSVAGEDPTAPNPSKVHVIVPPWLR